MISLAERSQNNCPRVFSCHAMPWRCTRSRKSHCEYRLRADFAKCVFSLRKFSGVHPMLVKLQRPPPEMRIFSPGARAWSTTSVSGPAWAAHMRPAAPAPRIRVLTCIAVIASSPTVASGQSQGAATPSIGEVAADLDLIPRPDDLLQAFFVGPVPAVHIRMKDLDQRLVGLADLGLGH